MAIIKCVLRILWEFPQLMLSVLCLFCCWLIDDIFRIQYDKKNKVFKVLLCEQKRPFSLGIFIFLPDSYTPMSVYEHELGHSKQSTVLGPFYFLVVCIPSVIWSYIRNKYDKDYYTFYTEKWADKYNNIRRS